MRKMLFALSLLAAAQAQALVTFSGSIDQGITPPDDDFAPATAVLFGREVTIDQYAQVKLTAVYSEANYTNAFLTVGGVSYSDVIDGSSLTFDFGPGLLPFSFFVTDTATAVVNGGNQLAWEAGGSSPFYAVTPVETDSDGVASFYIALNDNGFGDASSPDQDLDDYVIRADVKALPVPEPGAMALLGLGAVGVGLTRFKRRK
jgi:hypothetical protein